MPEASATVTILNELGLHAKPASAFAAMASTFESVIAVSRTDGAGTADGKSMLSLLTLVMPSGTEVIIRATGSDADRAVAELSRLVASRFGEA